jgi:hypothetical protein
VPYTRDPLSVRFDGPAAAMLGRAIAGAGRGRWIPGLVESGAHEQRERTGARLSVSERAFQRAMYHDPRIHKPRRGTGDWSLKAEWGEIIGRRRLLRVRVFRDTTGARKVRRDYGGESYVKNPALRSTWGMDQQAERGRDVVIGRGRRGRPSRRGV